MILAPQARAQSPRPRVIIGHRFSSATVPTALQPIALFADRRCRFQCRRRSRQTNLVAVVAAASSSSSSSSSSQPPPPPPPDFNALQTRLLRAIEQEDYVEAARARDALREASAAGGEGDSDGIETLLPAWGDLPLSSSSSSTGDDDDEKTKTEKKKTPHWLAQRAEQLGYLYPTIVQRKAYEALSSPGGGGDAVVVAPTGSGKTLAFLMPLLSRLDYNDDDKPSSSSSSSPFPDEISNNTMRRIKPVQLVVVVPTRDLGVQIALLIYKLFGGSVSKRVPGSKDNMFSFTGPRGLVVRGVLDEGEALRARVGGGLRGATVVVGTPDLLLEACPRPEEAEERRRRRRRKEGGGEIGGDDVDVDDDVDDEIFPLGSTSVAIAVDEADACLDLHGDALPRFLLAAMGAAVLNGRRRPDVVLVGASAVSGGALRAGVEGGWLRRDAARVVVGAAAAAPGEASKTAAAAATAEEEESTSSTSSPLLHLPRIPSSIKHRICTVDSAADALPVLARLLRGDAAAAGPDAAPPRTIVFARDEAAARAAATALRASLWGVHSLAVLLPGGREPVRAAHAFRDGVASLLVATPRAARGLDLPAVDAVYCLGPPEAAAAAVSSTSTSTYSSGDNDDEDESDSVLAAAAADYLHRAGRAGRLGAAIKSSSSSNGSDGGGGDGDGDGSGSDGGGDNVKNNASAVVTSVVVRGEPEERTLREVASALGVSLEEVEAPPPPAELLQQSQLEEGEEEQEEGAGERRGAETAAAASSAEVTAASGGGADDALRRGLEDIFWTREAPEPEASASAGGGRGGNGNNNDDDGDDDDDNGALDNEE